MSSLIELFHASPEACFEDIGRSVSALDKTVLRTSDELQKIAALVDKLVLGKLSTFASQSSRQWMYDVRLPNKYFPGIYDAETTLSGAKRWVGPSGAIGGTLLLPRSHQYRFEVQIVDFATPMAEASFSLVIDGEPYPWLNTDDRLYRTLILEAAEREDLSFSLAVDPETCNSDGVSFSFAHIRVEAA